MRSTFLLTSAVVLLTSCGENPKINTKLIGRYTMIAGTENSPMLLLDTTTGCLEQIVKITEARESHSAIYARQYLDNTLSSETISAYKKSDDLRLAIGTKVRLEKLQPPKRCGK